MAADDNVAQMKDDINSGRTRDKSPGFDPAAAPLGTDDEAAGSSVGAAEISQARRAESRDIPATATKGVSDIAAPNGRTKSTFPAATPFIVTAAIGIFILALAGVFPMPFSR